ncbi:MAG: dTDP-4-dehydrorhamnose 3,5-epimerase [Bacteroidales bacterium]|nr:dTDP-4-dehydrorhamnose 3,5-epimerase [Bacteroidales bacterium]
MKIQKTELEGVFIIQPDVFEDERGYFFEAFNAAKYREFGLPTDFVQDNESKSKKNVLRGLHFQKPPYAQGKLIRVIQGKVLDVAVDLRKGSTTFGKWTSVILSADNKTTFWVPAGFAHGFATLADENIVLYKCTTPYNKESEGSIRWNDPDINVQWNIDNPILSPKDTISPFLKDFSSPF